MNCRSIKELLVGGMTDQMEVCAAANYCVLTLPFKTLDDRFVEVFVEPKIGDQLLVHDGGKTVAELFVQGLHWTEPRRAQMAAIARRFGITVTARGVFQTACKSSQLSIAVMAVGQCASLGMFDVLSHAPKVEDEPASVRVKRTLREWKAPHFNVKHNVHVRGRKTGAEHFFDSVAHGLDRRHKTVAVKVLVPGYGPQVQADRYGFLALDIERTEYDKWRRLAVVSKSDQWPADALKIVRKLSQDTLEVKTGAESMIERTLVDRVAQLAAA